MKKGASHLSREITLHICKDGTVTYRKPGEPVFNGVALPFFTVDSEAEAKQLQIILCKRQYTSHPLMPGQPWYAVAGFAGTLDAIEDMTSLFAGVYEKMKQNK